MQDATNIKTMKKIFDSPHPVIFRNKIAFYIFTYRLPMYIYRSHCHVRKNNKRKSYALMHKSLVWREKILELNGLVQRFPSMLKWHDRRFSMLERAYPGPGDSQSRLAMRIRTSHISVCRHPVISMCHALLCWK